MPIAPAPPPSSPPQPPRPLGYGDLDNKLAARRVNRAKHAKMARSHLVAGSYSNAVSAFNTAILLTAASTHSDAIKLASSDRWKSSDPRRLEVAELYSGRALAYLRQERFSDALIDAHAAAFLTPNGTSSLSLLAAASANFVSLPQEPIPFFDDPMPGASEAEAAAAARSMTQQLAHGLVADVYSMLSEADGVELGSSQQAEILRSRDHHAARSHSFLHPLGNGSTTSRPPSSTGSEAWRVMTMAIESLAVEPLPSTASTPATVLLAQKLISFTAFRLGCRESELSSWRPHHLRGRFHGDRVIEQWLRSRVET